MLLFVLISSCASTKEVKENTNIFRRPEKVLEEVSHSDLSFKTVQLKASVQMNDNKQKFSFKANIRMKKDSVIWSSLTFLGIAGARTLITSDSIKIVNYKDDNYIVEDYEGLQNWLNTTLLTLPNLQNILLGDFVEVDNDLKYRLKYDGEQYQLSTISSRRIEKDWMEKKIEKLEKRIEKQEEKNAEKRLEKLEKKQERKPKYEGQVVEILVDPLTFKSTQVFIKDYFYGGSLTANYSDFRNINGQMIPHKVNMIMESSNTVELNIEYSKVSVDREISVPFSIPKKYERARL
jgi:hypothetical protein